MELLSKERLYKEFVRAGFVEFIDHMHKPHEHEIVSLRSKFNDIDTMDFAYAIVVRIYDLHRIPNYPKHMQRFNYEAHVSYYGQHITGEPEIPATQIHYTVDSVKTATDHAYRMWNALGRTTE